MSGFGKQKNEHNNKSIEKKDEMKNVFLVRLTLFDLNFNRNVCAAFFGNESNMNSK